MAYSGLETLFQNMGPAFASSMAGSREADSQFADMQTALKEAQALQDAQQKHAQNAQMNPLLVAHQSLQNQGLQAQMGGHWADSSLKTTNAAKAAGTLTSDIAKTNSANDVAIDEDKFKRMQAAQQRLQMWGAQFEGAQGPGAKEAVKQAMLQDVGDSKQAHLLANLPADQIPIALSKMNDHIVKQSGDYMKALMTATTSAEASMYGHDVSAEASIYATDARERIAKARQGAKKSVEDDIIKNGKTFEARAGIYDAHARKAIEKGDAELATYFTQMAEQNRAQQIAKGRAGVEAANEVKLNPNLFITPPAGASKPAAASKELSYDPKTGTFK